MEASDFDALVRRLEREARENLILYRAKVFLLALLGYIYIFLCVALVLPFLLHPYLWGLSLPILFVILRALWVKSDAPRGIPLESDQAPRLYGELRRITRALHCPSFDRIVVTNDLNAAVCQVPRLGVFGWYRSYLVLGLPLMMALSPEQYRAVLAHEFAHLFGAHGRFGGWIYRVRRTWDQLMQGLEKRQPRGSFLFRRFFRWYAPFFDAYSLVLLRRHEYEADRFAADWVGGQNMADELVSMHVKEKHLEEVFWPAILKRADHCAEPPASPFAEMQEALRGSPPAEKAEAWLKQGLGIPTSSVATHPSLPDRLAALNEQPRLPAAPQERAAEHFLGPSLPAFIAALDAEWRSEVAQSWKERYDYVQKAKQKLAALAAKSASQTLSEEEAYEVANSTEELEGAMAALPLYQRCLTLNAEHVSAHYSIGRILLANNEAAGIEHLEKSMKKDPFSVIPACELIHDYYCRHEEKEKAQGYYDRAIHQQELLQKAEAERRCVESKSAYLPHDLDDLQIEAIVNKLERFPEAATALLVRKHVQYLPEIPFYVLALTWRFWRFIRSESALLQRLAEEVQVPKGTMLFVSVNTNQRLREILAGVPFSRIYRRPMMESLRLRLRERKTPSA